MTQTENPSPTPELEAPSEPAPPVLVTAEDLSFPEGAVVLDSVRDEFLDVINNAEMSPAERANALVSLSNKVLEGASEANSTAWTQQQESWQNEVRNDPEIGGAKFQGTMEAVGRLVEEYGSQELREVLDLTGAGNSVHLVRFLNKLAGQLTESSTPIPGVAPATAETAANRLFPSMKG